MTSCSIDGGACTSVSGRVSDPFRNPFSFLPSLSKWNRTSATGATCGNDQSFMVRDLLLTIAQRIEKGVRMEQAAFSLDRPSDQPSVSQVERWLTLATATALITYGFSRRSLPGMFLAIAATPIAYRGVAGSWPRLHDSATDDTRAALGGVRGIHVREGVRLEKPVAEVYRFWRTLENLPLFMSHLRRVTDLGNGRSHWEAKGPANLKVEWDAEIINDVENRVIGWRSLPGSDVVTAGSVNFTEVRAGRGTQVAVHLQYAPPAGRAGALVASLFGREPSQMIREDLRRFKQLLEAGEIPRAAADAWDSR